VLAIGDGDDNVTMKKRNHLTSLFRFASTTMTMLEWNSNCHFELILAMDV